MTYVSWDTEWGRQFFVILGHFWPFYSPMNTENQNFEKMEKAPDDIILQMCTITEDHMMCGSWNMECTRQNFLSFGLIFALLPP